MTDTEAYQARAYGNSQLTVLPQVSQGRVYALINVPAEFTEASQGRILMAAKFAPTTDVSEARVFALARGRIDNRRLRDWAFPLDGHDLYVLRLGEEATIVYDLTTGQWADWSGHDLPYWRAHLGQAWTSIGAELLAQGHTTQIVAGDDSAGLLWTLAPELGADESPRADLPEVPFDRIVTGGVPMRMRDSARCNFVFLTASLGEPALTGSQVTLRTSDDAGHTWTDHGGLTVAPGAWGQRLTWFGLGLMQPPGRIFSVEDDGAVIRIDGLDME